MKFVVKDLESKIQKEEIAMLMKRRGF